MKQIFFLLLITNLLNASLLDMSSFEADFNQVITDDKGKELSYTGNIIASKPQYALWQYKEPIDKSVYINSHTVTIIEPDIEQAIIRKIASDFDFFKMIQKAKKISQNKYITTLNSSKYTILLENSLIKSISYLDEFENRVTIFFSNQKKDRDISKNIFIPNIPVDYDTIRD